MATVAASTEKLAELKAEESAAVAEVAPASEDAAVPEASKSTDADAPGDVAMADDDESDKKLRATRQSTSPPSVINCLCIASHGEATPSL